MKRTVSTGVNVRDLFQYACAFDEAATPSLRKIVWAWVISPDLRLSTISWFRTARRSHSYVRICFMMTLVAAAFDEEHQYSTALTSSSGEISFAVLDVIPPVAVSRCEVKEEVAVASFSCRYSPHIVLYSAFPRIKFQPSERVIRKSAGTIAQE